jgi:exonuclease VII large subunit
VATRRFENAEIILYPLKVQGEGAKEEIASAIEALNE